MPETLRRGTVAPPIACLMVTLRQPLVTNGGTDHPRTQPQREALGTTDSNGGRVVTAEAEPAHRFGREKFPSDFALIFSVLLSAALMVLAVSLVG